MFYLFFASLQRDQWWATRASRAFSVVLNILRKVHFPINMMIKLFSIACFFHII